MDWILLQSLGIQTTTIIVINLAGVNDNPQPVDTIKTSPFGRNVTAPSVIPNACEESCTPGPRPEDLSLQSR